MKTILSSVIRITVVMFLLCGLVYPLFITGISQLVMEKQADGSLIYDKDGNVIGSAYIGQNFTDKGYFHGRVSSIDYQAEASGSSNYALSNPDLKSRLEESIATFKEENPSVATKDIPIDLITNSGSGLDPHITPAAAMVQVDRISSETGISKEVLQQLVKDHTEGRSLGVFGEKRVNVLKLNMEVKKLAHQTS